MEAPARPVERRAEMQISPGFSFTKLHYAIMRYDTSGFPDALGESSRSIKNAAIRKKLLGAYDFTRSSFY